MRFMMRIGLVLISILTLSCSRDCPPPKVGMPPASAETPPATPDQVAEGPDGFDGALASRLGADDYGMAQYVMAFLKAGPNRGQSEEEAQKLQRAHLDNIARMAKEGTLVVAGPFMDDGDVRGIYIFDVASVEEAKALTETDPAIQAGRLTMELRPWYGSAALRDVGRIHDAISKENP